MFFSGVVQAKYDTSPFPLHVLFISAETKSASEEVERLRPSVQHFSAHGRHAHHQIQKEVTADH